MVLCIASMITSRKVEEVVVVVIMHVLLFSGSLQIVQLRKNPSAFMIEKLLMFGNTWRIPQSAVESGCLTFLILVVLHQVMINCYVVIYVQIQLILMHECNNNGVM